MKKLLLPFIFLLLIACNNTKPQVYELPKPEDVVIYQINPRVFAKENSFNAITAYLDSIKNLGANIIWFMPIHEIGKIKSVNSPYSVQDYRSVNSEFGTIEDFKNLIVESHKRGIGVIMDWVPNHTSWDNPWIENKDWYTQDSLGNIISPEGTGWLDVADLNFDNHEMRLAMIDAMKFWVNEVGIDGFRCDAVDFVPMDFLKQAVDSLRNIPNRKLLMLAEGKRKDHFDAGFDLNYAWDFHEQMRDVYIRDSAAASLFEANREEYDGIPAGRRKLRFSTNHDEAMKQSPVKEWTNLRGSMSAFATILFFPSCPMIYSSQEVGYPEAINFFNYVPVDWKANPTLRKEYEKLMQVYNSHNVLRTGELKAYPDRNILLFERYSGNNRYIIAINVRNTEQSMQLPGNIANNAYKNLFSDRNLSLNQTLTLQPYEYLILK